jgi:nitrogen fixation protein FixH
MRRAPLPLPLMRAPPSPRGRAEGGGEGQAWRARSAANAGTRRRSLIPLLFPAAFLPVFIANGLLAYFALHSMPALVDNHPFEDGRTYNRELAAAKAQAALGWTAALTTDERAGVPGPVWFVVNDRDGAPVTGLAVELLAWRPVGAEPATRRVLAEINPGHYRADLALPLSGQWQFDIVARRGADEYVLGRRIIVK